MLEKLDNRSNVGEGFGVCSNPSKPPDAAGSQPAVIKRNVSPFGQLGLLLSSPCKFESRVSKAGSTGFGAFGSCKAGSGKGGESPSKSSAGSTAFCAFGSTSEAAGLIGFIGTMLCIPGFIVFGSDFIIFGFESKESSSHGCLDVCDIGGAHSYRWFSWRRFSWRRLIW